MKINLVAAGALAAALAIPVSVCAQQTQYPGPTQSRSAMPSHERLTHRWMKRLGQLNLSGDQQRHVQSLIDEYSRAHPEGSAVERGAGQQLRQQIMGVLSSDQQNQYRQAMRARRAQMQQRRAQMQQQGGQEGQQYRDQQGQSYQQGPQGQQGQEYQQGPQYPQGPPNQQQPPYQGQPYGQGPPNQGPSYPGQPDEQGPAGQEPPAAPPV